MKNIRRFEGHIPQIDKTAFVDESAVVTGNVIIGEDSSVWPCCSIRGDIHRPATDKTPGPTEIGLRIARSGTNTRKTPESATSETPGSTNIGDRPPQNQRVGEIPSRIARPADDDGGERRDFY